ncbi:DUF2783 domain-containing protein [Roseicyclus persicicus]|nr:DUF2783 domain-containing protein [Roseibacterium persicicum]
MGKLTLDPNLAAPDDAYAALIEAHEGLTREESEALNARLILILMNQVGDLHVIREALAAARR